MDLNVFKQLPIMGILRGGSVDIVPELTETVIRAGLKTIEVAMNTPQAAQLIEAFCQASQGRLTVGAGTVLTLADLRQARDAGATFIVMPVLVDEVAQVCRESHVPFFPGALTPQEIYQAWQAGAAMVKVFPAKVFGPKYFKEIKGPLDQVELLACGGVTADNISEHFSQGADAVAFGGSIFRKEWLTSDGLGYVKTEIEKLIQAFNLKEEAS